MNNYTITSANTVDIIVVTGAVLAVIFITIVIIMLGRAKS